MQALARRTLFGQAVRCVVLLLIAVAAIGARCIENVAILTDDAGHTVMLGEIYNDTDVQGTRMTVRLTLLDANGNAMASKDTRTCPPDLQPHGLSSYAVQFDELNLPPAASWDVRPVSAVTLESPLPESGVVVASADASWSGETVNVKFSVENNSDETYERVQLCAVTYDAENKVRSWNPFDPTGSGKSGTLTAQTRSDLSFTLRGQAGAVSARVWLWIPGSTTDTSPYQPVMTAPLVIE